MRQLLITTILLTAPCTLAAEDPLPVYEEPRHRLMLSSQTVQVLDLLIPPGDTTLYHLHEAPIFYITLSASTVRLQNLGGEWVEAGGRPAAQGSVRTNDSYVESPITHRVNNSGMQQVRSILVLNIGEAPRYTSGEHSVLPGETEIESPWFRQSRFVLQGGETLDVEGIAAPTVFVLLNDSHVVASPQPSEYQRGLTTEGSFFVIIPTFGIQFQNRTDEPATLIAVAVL